MAVAVTAPVPLVSTPAFGQRQRGLASRPIAAVYPGTFIVSVSSGLAKRRKLGLTLIPPRRAVFQKVLIFVPHSKREN
jgi:hypothetical protein